MSIQVHQLDSGGVLREAPLEFERGIYPGGEVWVKLQDASGLFNVPTLVTARIGNLVDLGYFHETVQCLRVAGLRAPIYAFLPYLPGARSDRASAGPVMPKGLDLYANLLNSLEFQKVITLDVHSNAAYDAIPNLLNLSSVPAVNACIEKFDAGVNHYIGVLAPDEGARSRARLVANDLGVSMATASKQRDMGTGRLSGFTPPVGIEAGRWLLVDDICDGGGTFAGLLDALDRQYNAYYKFDLFVTHGIFSGNAKKNLDGFGRVLTTDSVAHQDNWRSVSAFDTYKEMIAKEMSE